MTVHERATSYRSKSSAETLRIAETQARRLGITRVTEVTRLDRLGIPVFTSIRPRGIRLQVHAGKGLTAIDARVGALMEAIEFAVSEPHGSSVRLSMKTLAEIVDQFGGSLDWIDFAPPLGKRISMRRSVAAVRCDVLGCRRRAWMPAELVFVPFEGESFQPVFGWSANGIASGNSTEEASLHALFEVLERDAVAIHAVRDASRWVVPGSLPSRFQRLARRWRRDRVMFAVRELPNTFALPCFAAYLFDRQADGARIFAGMGLHTDRSIALGRSICEAAQSRLSMIHGGRQDVTRFFEHDASARRAREDVIVSRLFDRSRRVSLRDVVHVPLRGRSIVGLLDDMVGRLNDVGFPRVLRYRFKRALGGLHVVRVIVPGCEQIGGATRRVGPRLMARMLGDA